jgi:hypothetical protein
MCAGMDEDNANEVLLELPIKESNVCVATLSEVLPDNISRLLWVPHALNPMSSDIDLWQPMLQEMLFDCLVVRAQDLSSCQNTLNSDVLAQLELKAVALAWLLTAWAFRNCRLGQTHQ